MDFIFQEPATLPSTFLLLLTSHMTSERIEMSSGRTGLDMSPGFALERLGTKVPYCIVMGTSLPLSSWNGAKGAVDLKIYGCNGTLNHVILYVTLKQSSVLDATGGCHQCWAESLIWHAFSCAGCSSRLIGRLAAGPVGIKPIVSADMSSKFNHCKNMFLRIIFITSYWLFCSNQGKRERSPYSLKVLFQIGDLILGKREENATFWKSCLMGVVSGSPRGRCISGRWLPLWLHACLHWTDERMSCAFQRVVEYVPEQTVSFSNHIWAGGRWELACCRWSNTLLISVPGWSHGTQVRCGGSKGTNIHLYSCFTLTDFTMCILSLGSERGKTRDCLQNSLTYLSQSSSK